MSSTKEIMFNLLLFNDLFFKNNLFFDFLSRGFLSRYSRRRSRRFRDTSLCMFIAKYLATADMALTRLAANAFAKLGATSGKAVTSVVAAAFNFIIKLTLFRDTEVATSEASTVDVGATFVFLS